MKRTEPTLQQWEKLYEVAGFIKQLKPWEYLLEDNIIIIQMPDRKEPMFCSVIGGNDEMYAIIVYPDYRSFAERNQLLATPDMPYYILASSQNCLMCNFANREDLSNEDYKIIKDLGLKFRGKNQWIYFNSFKTGYAPWIIDAEQADIMIGALQNFIMAFRSYLEGKLKVDFENGKVLIRFYSKEKELWFNCETAMPEMPKLVSKRITVQDDLYIARLKTIKKTKSKVEMDLFYLPTPIKGKKDELPYYPQMCIVADESGGGIVDQHILDGSEKEEDVVIGLLDRYIAQFGRPQSILIRDERMEGLIGDLCSKCGIKINKSGTLEIIDSFAEEFLGSIG